MQGLGKQKCQVEEEIMKRRVERRKHTDRITSNILLKLERKIMLKYRILNENSKNK